MANKDDFLKLQKQLEKYIKESEKELDDAFKESLANIKKILAEVFEKYSDNDILKREEMVKFNRLAKLESKFVEQIQILMKKQIQITKNAIKKIFVESYYRYGYYIEKQVEQMLYKLLNNKTIESIIYNSYDAIKWTERIANSASTLINSIREVVNSGINQGLSYFKITKMINEKYSIGLNKAKVLARNETRRAQSEASLQTMAEASKKGFITKKMWVSALDERVRNSHRHLDGQKIDVDEMFTSNSGFKALAPHLFGVPSEDLNCRCVSIPVIEIDGVELGQNVRRARNNGDKNRGEIIDYTTYNNWKKDLDSR